MSKYQDYLKTYAGRTLLEKYSLTQEGMWQIFGEDPNCDFHGHHYQPDLGFVEGKLQDVIEYAVNHSGFWQWGAGGNIKLINQVKKINPDANARRAELSKQLKDLQDQVAKIQDELTKL